MTPVSKGALSIGLTLTASFRRNSSWSGACTGLVSPSWRAAILTIPTYIQASASTKNFLCWWRRACRPWRHCKPRRLARHASWDRQSVGEPSRWARLPTLCCSTETHSLTYTTPRPSAPSSSEVNSCRVARSMQCLRGRRRPQPSHPRTHRDRQPTDWVTSPSVALSNLNETCEGETDRYIVMPARGPGYKLGQLEIRRLRELVATS